MILTNGDEIMAKGKDQTKYLELASEIVNTMKVLLESNKKLTEDQKTLLTQIQNLKDKTPFQSEKELKDFVAQIPEFIKEVNFSQFNTDKDPIYKQLSLLGQSLLKCDEKDITTAKLLMNQYKAYYNSRLSSIQEDDLALYETQDNNIQVKNVVSPGFNDKHPEQKTIESSDPLTKNLVELANSLQEARQQKLSKTPNSQIDQTTNVVADSQKDLSSKDPNLVLAEKLVRDLEKLVSNQSPSQEKNDFLELIKETKGSNTQIIFDDRKALDQFQSSYYKKSGDLDLQDANKQVALDNSDFKLQQAIEKNLEVLDKLSARQEPKIETELKDLVKSMQAVDPKFYDKVKIPKTPPSLEVSQEKVKEYNVAMRSEKSPKIHKKIKRAFKSAKAKVSSIGSAVSNKVTEFTEGAKEKGTEWKDRVKTKVNSWRGRS